MGPSTAQHLYSVSPFSSITTVLKPPTHLSWPSPLPVGRARRPPSSHGPALPPGSRCLGTPPPGLRFLSAPSPTAPHLKSHIDSILKAYWFCLQNIFEPTISHHHQQDHPRLNHVSSRRLTAPSFHHCPVTVYCQHGGPSDRNLSVFILCLTPSSG